MKIEKIKMIEEPKEEILLSNEAMEDLLGGINCGILGYGKCNVYNTLACGQGSESDIKCGQDVIQ